MKVKTINQFTPVQITLETQEEVNQLFAVLNFNPVAEAIKSEGHVWQELREHLYAIQNGYSQWHKKLLDKFERG